MSTSKVFIVTGASKGIGAAVTRKLISDSHKVVLAARSAKLLEQIKSANPDQIEYVAGDMTDPEISSKLVQVAVQKFGRLDGMVINHGVLENKLVAETSLESIKRTYEVNVFSCVAMAQAGLQEIKKTQGCIIWVSSGAALKAYQGWGAYGSSKAAMNAFCAHLALEEPDITSVAIGPGRVDTDMQALIRTTGKDTMQPAVYQTFVDGYEAGELLKPEQPGGVIARLVASPLKEVSGQYISWNAPALAAYQS